MGTTKGESTDAHARGGSSRSSDEAFVMKVERRGGLSAKKMYFANRGTGMSVNLPSRFVIARWQGNGWDEPYKSRGLRTVLWAAGGVILPADPANHLARLG